MTEPSLYTSPKSLHVEGTQLKQVREQLDQLLEDHPPHSFYAGSDCSENGKLVLAYRCGLRTAVERHTSRAVERSPDEFERAAPGLFAKITHYLPQNSTKELA